MLKVKFNGDRSNSKTNKNYLFSLFETVSHFVHQHFISLLLVCYGLAVICPGFGLHIRNLSLGNFNLLGEKVSLSAPVLMLSFLLFNAGFGIKATELQQLKNKPIILVAGLLGNTLTPIIFILLVWACVIHWHNLDEAQNVLVGLALIASMPIAGSSTAWSQNANGNLAISIGLVLLSTIFSPLITPSILQSASSITLGDYAEDLTELAQTGIKTFLIISVVIPILLGAILRILLKEQHGKTATVWLKAINSIILLLLIYSNAAVCLPQTIAKPDWDFLILILIITVLLCLTMFIAGYVTAKIFNSNHDDLVALVFGLGMNNNGTGLVLASTQLSDHPAVLLPIVFYNLIQHLIAGAIYSILARKPINDFQQ
jgi:BASS family bile acid:Na+ symporter